MKDCIAIVQARYSSSRLPGKVLRPLQGRPMLEWTIESLEQCKTLDQIVLATSEESSDDAVAEWAKQRGIDCWRGPLDHVATRFAQVLKEWPCTRFVRVNGDSPLICPDLIDQAVTVSRANLDTDLVTNLHPRTFPPGQSVEVLSSKVFLSALDEILCPEDQEHVTKFFYKNSRQFNINNIAAQCDYPEIHMAIDTERDWFHLERLSQNISKPHWEYPLEELCLMWKNNIIKG